jgi:hypothetical protein
MSASKLTYILVIVITLHLVSTQLITTTPWFQPVQNYTTNTNIKLIDNFVRSLHPTELSSATLSDADASQDNQNYRLLYVTQNGQNYMSVVRQTTPSSSMSELYWNPVNPSLSPAATTPQA